MATVDQTIEVEVPVTTAYNQWTQFETFPEFMGGVESVRQLDDTTLHFSTNTAGVHREYDARILDQVPDSVISWESMDGPRNAGLVRFEPLGPDRTRVNVTIEWTPEGVAEKTGAAVGVDELQVGADLNKFKKFIENRGTETGAWRSTVVAGEVDEPPAGSGGTMLDEEPPPPTGGRDF